MNINYKRFYIIETEDEKRCENANKDLKIAKNGRYKDNCVVSVKQFIDNILEISNSSKEEIVNKDKHFAILQMLRPQYVNNKNNKENNINNTKLKFGPGDAYELDDDQRCILASLNKRVYLKAAAGTGKTILLLAKAYEVAIANPEKEFLILCYNRKLREDILRMAENTGKITNNLRILTFNKFIREELNIKYGDDSNAFKMEGKRFREEIRDGTYVKKFGGIFIDEMQQLDEESISALIECLDDNKYMILAGDYYQQIRNFDAEYDDDEIYEEDDKENKNLFYIGEYDFEKIILDKNYRNSEKIVKVLGNMQERMEQYIEDFQIHVKNEKKKKVLGIGARQGVDKPHYFHVYNTNQEVNKIMECLENLIEGQYKSCPGEILLVTPWGNENIKKLLEDKMKARWDWMDFCDFEKNKLGDYGVKFGTIGKSIGLDFKAVILFGTSVLVEEKESATKKKFATKKEIETQGENVKSEFIRCLNHIYVACSRARDTLIVIDDIDEENNLISQFLKLVKK